MPNKLGLTFKATRRKSVVVPDKNVFDSYEEEADEQDRTEAFFRPTKIARADQQVIEDAVKQDPLIFEYDEVIEERCTRPIEKNCRSEEKAKPRYIQNLLKASEERQAERERRIERRIQEERKQEGDMYADKEVFVTNAYREKLRAMEEMDRARMEAEKEEALLDVRKQGNLNSFYRFMLKNGLFNERAQKEEAINDSSKETRKQEQPIIMKRTTQRNRLRRRRSGSEESGSQSEEEKITESNDQDCEATAENQQDESTGGEVATQPDEQAKDDADAKTDEANEKKEDTSYSKEEILKKLEERVNKIFEGLQKRTVDERFREAVEEYQIRKSRRLQPFYTNPQLQIDAT